MKQIEVTVRVIEEFESASRKLVDLGFRKIRESNIDDIYMTLKKDELNINNIQYVLKNSVLLRYLQLEGKEIKKITYKSIIIGHL